MIALTDIIYNLHVDISHRDAEIDRLKAELDAAISQRLSADSALKMAIEERNSVQAELAEVRNDLTTTQARLSNALAELRCPDCKCADQVDAESNECGCDSPVCARIGDKTLAEAFISANADADLLGREANAWRAEYKKWNDGNHHFHEPFDAVADTDARPTAAARVKGGA